MTSVDIYRLRLDHQYQRLVPPEDPATVDVLHFDGARIGESWVPLQVEIDDDEPDQLPPADLSLLTTGIPILSRRSVDALRDKLIACGEILPLDCACGEYFAYNVTEVIDALNVDASEIVRFTSGRIMDVKRYVLYEDRLGSALIFKLPQVPRLDVFVTARFVKLVNENHLSGLVFQPI